MRFERLCLERYGHFTGKVLDLSGDEVGLHIVHGRNEAGKSTILCAISDLLFGVQGRTTFGFLHGYESLRIGATIVSRAGERLIFKRRKGNARTLLTEDGGVLPDGALVPFLGDADRGLFERMFGLDHQRLREAGRRMIETDGDLGRSLFEAGSGLDGVDRVLAGLQSEIDAIGTPERKSSKKPLWHAAEDFADAQKAKRQRALRHEEFHAAEATLAAAASARARIDEELGSIRERRSRLERIRRAGPILAEIDRFAHEIAAYADIPDLPATFEDERLRCAEALLAAETAVGTARAAEEALAQELETIPASDTFSRFATEIRALQTRLGEYLKGIADEPKLSASIASCDDEIGRHVAALGLALDPAETIERLPSKPLVAKIRAAIREGDKLRTKLEKAEEEAAGAEKDLAAAEDELGRLEGIDDPAPARTLVEAAAKHGDVATALSDRRRDVADAAREAREALERIAGWTLGIEALATTPFPSLEAIHEHEQRLQKLTQAREAAASRRDEVDTEILDISAEIASLEAAGDIPSTRAVAAARDHRDRLWQRVRDPSVERPETALLGDYELSVRQADELADRRVAEAQRIARFAELSGRRQKLSARARDARARIDDLTRDLTALAEAWQSTFGAVGALAEAPAAMRALVAAKDAALRRLAEQRRAEEGLDRAKEAAESARNLLLSAARVLGLTGAEAPAFDDLDREVMAALGAQERDWARRQAAEEAARLARRALQEKQQDVEALEQAIEAWQEAWSSLVGDMCGEAQAGPDEATAMLETWDHMREPLTRRAETVRRLAGLRIDITRYRDDLRGLVSGMSKLARERGETIEIDDGAAPETVARSWSERLEEETLRLARRADVAARLEGARHASAKAQADLALARKRLADLRLLHRLDESADLADLGRRAAEKARLALALRTRREELLRTGEGYDEAALREQCGSSSPDAAEAEVAALLSREAELVRDGQSAAQEETKASQALDELRARTGAAEADAEGHDAALAFAGHAERWLLLETARQLLIRAVERYRSLNENPMLTRASALLAAIAAGAENPITRLEVDYRDGRAPVILARRADGRACEVVEMSEGTRDQLFLCLRIAAIELYAEEREPLPFIADDLFVTSDDARVVPGLAALAELGRATQVILFTHHRHVVEAAGSLPPGSVRVTELSPA